MFYKQVQREQNNSLLKRMQWFRYWGNMLLLVLILEAYVWSECWSYIKASIKVRTHSRTEIDLSIWFMDSYHNISSKSIRSYGLWMSCPACRSERALTGHEGQVGIEEAGYWGWWALRRDGHWGVANPSERRGSIRNLLLQPSLDAAKSPILCGLIDWSTDGEIPWNLARSHSQWTPPAKPCD